MARPLSEEKRAAILEAATEAVASSGTGAPTARIAKAAGVAEGTLFTYFPSKDDLLNALYLSIKQDMRSTLPDITDESDPQAIFRQLWDGMIDWNLDSEAKSKAMRQLAVSDLITAETRATGSAPFRDIEAMFAAITGRGALKDVSPAFAGALLQSFAETVTQFISREHGQRARYKQAGFAMLWNAITAP